MVTEPWQRASSNIQRSRNIHCYHVNYHWKKQCSLSAANFLSHKRIALLFLIHTSVAPQKDLDLRQLQLLRAYLNYRSSPIRCVTPTLQHFQHPAIHAHPRLRINPAKQTNWKEQKSGWVRALSGWREWNNNTQVEWRRTETFRHTMLRLSF